MAQLEILSAGTFGTWSEGDGMVVPVQRVNHLCLQKDFFYIASTVLLVILKTMGGGLAHIQTCNLLQ